MELYRFIASDRELKEYREDVNTMVIKVEEDISKVSDYTTKKNFAKIEFNYNDTNVEALIAYIKEHLRICPRIELWNTFAGDKDAIVKKCSKNILNKDYIKELWGNDSLSKTKCLVVYNS